MRFVLATILINVVVFFLTFGTRAYILFGTIPLTLAFEPQRLATYMFLHGGLGHLFANMFSLFILGSLYERYYGGSKTALVYFASGAIAGLSPTIKHVLFNELSIGIGASGGIFGLFGAIVATPLRPLVLHPFNILAILVVNVPAVLNPSIGIDWLAHLLGFLAGFAIGLKYRRARVVRYYRPVEIRL